MYFLTENWKLANPLRPLGVFNRVFKIKYLLNLKYDSSTFYLEFKLKMIIEIKNLFHYEAVFSENGYIEKQLKKWNIWISLKISLVPQVGKRWFRASEKVG